MRSVKLLAMTRVGQATQSEIRNPKFPMRIIAGRLRRKSLGTPAGNLTRPTADRTREAIFNLLESRMDLDGADVLDLFAGTGALGFEALSRGALVATFVELNPQVLRVTRQNAVTLGVETMAVFLRAEAVAWLGRYSGPAFHLILADPPYELPALPRLPDLALPHLQPGGVLVLEHDRRHRFDAHPRLDTTRTYGQTVVSVFVAGDDDAEPLS
jgi:16S rRNA (guanine(966)-N(2))-methyltransferase RsmD